MTRVLRMRWVDLAFLHWPVRADDVRSLIPSALTLDTFEGSAWIAVTPFVMTNVRPTFTPPIPTANDFPELNVRTYVSHDGRPGVWFFSLDGGSWLAVIGARALTNLPYYHARMDVKRVAEDVVYDSTRSHIGARPAEFRARYRPTGSVFRSTPGSFEYWCTERYSLFTRRGGLWRMDIEHARWPLQPASVSIQRNTMAQSARILLPEATPHAVFSGRLDVYARLPVRVPSHEDSPR